MNNWVYRVVGLCCQVVLVIFGGFATITQYKRYPQQNTKEVRTKPQTNCKICY